MQKKAQVGEHGPLVPAVAGQARDFERLLCVVAGLRHSPLTAACDAQRVENIALDVPVTHLARDFERHLQMDGPLLHLALTDCMPPRSPRTSASRCRSRAF